MKGNSVLRIGTRGSELALWQARHVQERLSHQRPELEIVIEIIRTKGDRLLDAPLAKIGGEGLFTREIEHALLSGVIDLAVHSLKDLPTELPEGLVIGAVTEREDVRDVFIAHPGNTITTLWEQPPGATIATGSLRRRCQLLHLRPDLLVAEMRGNLSTRMKKLEASPWAGMLLARAGVVRLGWSELIGETLDVETMLPAVGQGALAIEIREDDGRLRALAALLNHAPTERATGAERSLLRRLEGGCQVPIGAFGRLTGEEAKILKLDAMVGSLNGDTVVRGSLEGHPEEASELGKRLGDELLARGANQLLDAIRSPGAAR
jgi:hydroxymethylbilane synthase